MQASPRKNGMYYRCPARTLAPGSSALASHPPAVCLREDPVREAVNDWLGGLFAGENVDRTVAALVASQGGYGGVRDAVKARLSDAEGRLWRFQSAIEAGVDPAALVESINEAQAQRTALRAEWEKSLACGPAGSDVVGSEWAVMPVSSVVSTDGRVSEWVWFAGHRDQGSGDVL